MSTKPTVDQLTQLKNAIRLAFTHSELTRLTQEQLELSLEWITPVAGQRDLTTIVHDLVDYFASQPRGIKRLLTAACDQNPGSAELEQLATEWAEIDFAPIELRNNHPAKQIDTGGGIYVERDVHAGRDFIGRDQIIHNYNAVPPPEALYVNVPTMPTNYFLGRDELVTDIVDRLTSGAATVLSAEGLPGVGKTTLAVAIAHTQAILDHFDAGVLWAGLGPNGDVNGALIKWADALQTDVSDLLDPHAMAERLKSAIGTRRLLIVIDDVWEKEASQILRCGGPNCCHLITTRDQMIATDFAGHSEATAVPTLDDQAAYQLLRELAPQAWAADIEQCQKLVEQVGQLPLAIELLGGYLNAQSVSRSPLFADLQSDALTDLDDPQQRLQLAATRLGDSTQSSVTLQATIELSVESLPPAAADAFTRLGAFAPKPQSFDIEAALAVAQTDKQTLALLTARNLLEAGTDALALHQTLADVARAKMGEGDQARHFEHYLDLVEQNDEDWQTIEVAYGQIQWAWNHAPDEQSRFDLNYAVSTYQVRRGLWAERLEWLLLLLELARDSERQQEKCDVLHELGYIYSALGEKLTALDFYKQSLTIRQEIGDKSGEGTTLNNISQIYHDRGDYERALRYLEQSLTISQETGNKSVEGATLNNISQIYDAGGDYERALRYLEQSLTIRQEIGDKSGEGTTLNNIGGLYNEIGEKEKSLRYLEQSLTIRQEIGDKSGEGTTLNNISQIYDARGDYKTALRYLEQSLTIRQEIGDKSGEGATLGNIGLAYRRMGDNDKALAYYEQSLTIRQEIGDKSGLCATLFNIGHIHLQNDEQDEAYEKWIMVYQIASQIGYAQALDALAGLADQLKMEGGLDAWATLAAQMEA